MFPFSGAVMGYLGERCCKVIGQRMDTLLKATYVQVYKNAKEAWLKDLDL